jgi:EpsI family protein
MSAATPRPRRLLARTLVLAALMLAGAWLARSLTPHQYLADQVQRPSLERSLPQHFGDWRLDDAHAQMVVDPSQLELVNRLYQDTVSRSYVDAAGHRMMLTIAYGRDQSEGVQLHTPEFCYPAAGMRVGPSRHEAIALGFKSQPVVRLVANRGAMREPITYWVTMGEYVVNGGPAARRNVRFKYGFDGFIPDGALFRISSIGPNEAKEYALQEAFLRQFFQAVSPQEKKLLAGTHTY